MCSTRSPILILMKNHIIERNAAAFSVYPQPHKIVMNQDQERYDFEFDTLFQTIVKQEILSRWIRFKYFILVLSNLDIIYIVGSIMQHEQLSQILLY